MNHPDVFEFAHHFLNPKLGAANTIVLLASSLSVAWAVRCAQLNQQMGLLANLIFTVVCAGVFMGVKAVEYTLKFHEGLMWRGAYTHQAGSHPDLAPAHASLQQLGFVLLGVGVALVIAGLVFGANAVGRRWAFYALGATVLGAAGGCMLGNWYTHKYPDNPAEHMAHAKGDHAEGDHAEGDHAEGAHPEAGHVAHDKGDHAESAAPQHTASEAVGAAMVGAEATTAPAEMTEEKIDFGGEGPKFPGVFFSIYYAMTGVHAIHILAGIGVFVWIISRAARRHFDPEYYGPVEYTGLYWHLVDLIWIYLFPLLYLIQ